MYQLEEPFYFYLLLVVPILLIGFLILISWKRSIQNKYISNHLFKKLSPETSSFKPKFKLFLLSLTFIFISLGLVNPKIGTQLKTVKREGVDIVFAIDVSKSMLAEDIAPNRLEKAKRIVSQTINELNSDRVGIIAYAASALPVLPITTDYSTARMFLQSLNTDMLSSQGTAILEAVKLAKDYYDDENQTNRVLCILSDGEDHEFENQNIPSAIDEMGISIFTVGLGSTKGAPIPIKKNNVIESYKKNSDGDVVITKLVDKLLKEIAISSNGIYINGLNTELVVNEIVDKLKEMDKEEFESKQFIAYNDQFQWFIGFGLFFLCLELFVFEKKTHWVKKLNLFNEKKFKTFLFLLVSTNILSQNNSLDKISNNLTLDGNVEFVDENLIDAEAFYRTAIAKDSMNNIASYNMANAFYKSGFNKEALNEYKSSIKKAKNKKDLHKSFHNLGDVYMQSKDYQNAVNAFKNALLNNPQDDETRYNYALAKELLKNDNKKKDDKKGR
jgi:Ca-activated chloride channel family protein